MSEIHAPGGPLPPIPDDLTVPQFLLDYHQPSRPVRTGISPWLIDDETGRKIGFEELQARTFGLANVLRSRYNIGDGDVVCIYSPNHVDYPVVIWAVHRLGGIITGANPSYTADELINQLATTRATFLVAHPWSVSIAMVAAQLAGIPADRVVMLDTPGSIPSNVHISLNMLVAQGLSSPERFVERSLSAGEGKGKIAFLSLSSGTTGKPKAVAISHYSMIASIIQAAAHWKVLDKDYPREKLKCKPGEVVLGVLPFFHIYGLATVLHFELFCGLTVVVIPKFDFIAMLRSIQTHRINHLIIVPPQVVLLCKHPAVKEYDLSSVNYILSGAAPLSMEMMTQIAARFPNAGIGQGYGMTEVCGAVSFPRHDLRIGTPGSSGQLIVGASARVVKSDGSVAHFGEPGELYVKGPLTALYYLDNDKATRETFIDGWVRTGDEVVMNDKAEMFVVDRIKEIIKVKGFQVSPAELEGHILTHPDVSDTCVVGVLDEYAGELPLAFVALQVRAQERVKHNAREADVIKKSIMKHVSDSKVKYKWLTDVQIINVIPKNPSGKLLRKVLREKAKELKREGVLVIQSKL